MNGWSLKILQVPMVYEIKTGQSHGYDLFCFVLRSSAVPKLESTAWDSWKLQLVKSVFFSSLFWVLLLIAMTSRCQRRGFFAFNPFFPTGCEKRIIYSEVSWEGCLQAGLRRTFLWWSSVSLKHCRFTNLILPLHSRVAKLWWSRSPSTTHRNLIGRPEFINLQWNR